MFSVAVCNGAIAEKNVASSDAVKAVLHRYPWVGLGFLWEKGMQFKSNLGEDKGYILAWAVSWITLVINSSVYENLT